MDRLDFRIADLRDESGLSVRLRLYNQDLSEVQQDIVNDARFEPLFNDSSNGLSSMFLAKRLATTVTADRGSIWRALHVVQACVWARRQSQRNDDLDTLFLERRPWHEQIANYCRRNSLTPVPVKATWNVRRALLKNMPAGLLGSLRNVRHRRLVDVIADPFRRRRSSGSPGSERVAEVANNGVTHGTASGSPKVAVQCYGMLNLDNPERHSDLFFWQDSDLVGSDILLTFSIPGFPLDAHKKTELERHGINSAVLHPGATSLPTEPVYNPPKQSLSRQDRPTAGGTREKAWFREQWARDQQSRGFWTNLAESQNIKVSVTWDKFDATHCAISDAVKSAGGVSVVYQRGYESHSSPQNTVGADLFFGFSQQGAVIERLSNSRIRYYVAVGFLGDHRFPLVADSARSIRQHLRANGAKRILAYLDENSTNDPRWRSGNDIPQRDYGFLLERVVDDPEFGLLLKPKVVGTLRSRLGPVAPLLERAEATGRCKVYQDRDPGSLHGWSPPVEAALAADVCVHGYLSAATAGIETALAGVPTLLLDLESWPVSPLYELGVGKVVFNSWDDLWNACSQQWSSGPQIPGFGDWGPVLDQIDPYRDGHAAQRMGNYIHSLIEDFRQGRDRESAMANTAERFCARWGPDKITEVNVSETNIPDYPNHSNDSGSDKCLYGSENARVAEAQTGGGN